MVSPIATTAPPLHIRAFQKADSFPLEAESTISSKA